LRSFYGTEKTNEAYKTVDTNLRGYTKRDEAIKEYALDMGAQLDELQNQWNSGAPSAAFQDKMPNQLSLEAKKARAFLDPSYHYSQVPAIGTPSNPNITVTGGDDPFAQFGGKIRPQGQ